MSQAPANFSMPVFTYPYNLDQTPCLRCGDSQHNIFDCESERTHFPQMTKMEQIRLMQGMAANFFVNDRRRLMEREVEPARGASQMALGPPPGGATIRTEVKNVEEVVALNTPTKN
jgi:hypothetical protein